MSIIIVRLITLAVVGSCFIAPPPLCSVFTQIYNQLLQPDLFTGWYHHTL